MIENKEIEQFRTKYRVMVDDFFKEPLDDVEKYLGWSAENIDQITKIYKFYQNKDKKIATTNDIQTIYSAIGILSYHSWFSFFHIYKTMEDLREVTQRLVDIPLSLIEGALPEVLKQLDIRLNTLKKELEKLREEGVKVGLESYEKIEKGLELLVKKHEDAIKALRKMVV